MNHRQGERITVNIPVIAQAIEQTTIAGRVQNLSISGACIRCDTALLPDQNSLVKFTLHLQAARGCEPIRIKTQGYVVRKVENFLGIMFIQEKVWLIHWLKTGKLMTSPPFEISA